MKIIRFCVLFNNLGVVKRLQTICFSFKMGCRASIIDEVGQAEPYVKDLCHASNDLPCQLLARQC